MPSTYRTPGVYIEEISKFPPSVAQVETAIPAFIGYTQKAIYKGIDVYAKAAKPKDEAGGSPPTGADVNPAPTENAGEITTETETETETNSDDTGSKTEPIIERITSLLEYVQYFGTADPVAGISVTVADSGEVSARVNEPPNHNMYYSLQAFFANGGGPCYIVSVGKTSAAGTIELSRLNAGLKAIAKEDEVTLIVFPESLSLSDADFKTIHNDALAQCKLLLDRFVVMDAKLDTPGHSIDKEAKAFRNNKTEANNLIYGAAYGPRLETIFDYIYDESTVSLTLPDLPDEEEEDEDAGAAGEDAGAAAGEDADEDADENAGATADEDAALTMAEISPNSGSKYGRFYPIVKSAIGAIPVVLPASPLVVGVYAAVDSDRGVWKAPANVSLGSVIGPTVKISNAEQDNLNLDTTGKSINAIRTFAGKGTLIWGARTLAGNDNEWRYVPVRRFFNMAEESIKKATEAFVFEPNDANTWIKVKAMIENFLTLQWRAGALAGAKPDQAFYVKIGLNETMTALDILEGRMIVEIGMAVVRPAEFIILKFSHKMQES